jgi:SOS response regulatory protein OraA/RecX
MSFTDKPRAPRVPRKARPKISLKMQAIGFLSRREHSRQELRTKLLASLRRREREEAALAAASQAVASELAQALSEQPSNGIDDAFAPPEPSRIAPDRGGARAGASVHTEVDVGADGDGDGNVDPEPDSRRTSRRATSASLPPSLLDAVRLANGDPLPSGLRSSLASRQACADPDRGPDVVAIEVAADAGLEQQDPAAAVDRLLDWLVANKYLSETRFVEGRVNARASKQGTPMIEHELSRHGLVLAPEQAAALRETEFARAQALWQRKFGEVAADARSRAKQARFLAARGFAGDVVRRIVGGEEESW